MTIQNIRSYFNCVVFHGSILPSISIPQEERRLAPATIANHAASLLYPAKFLHRDSSPTYDGIKVIKQLRLQVAYFQRRAYTERPSTKEELEAQNRWLDWYVVVDIFSLCFVFCLSVCLFVCLFFYQFHPFNHFVLSNLASLNIFNI